MRSNLLASSNGMKGMPNHEDYSFQQQYGRTNHSRDSSGDDCTNFCEVKGPMSPTAWMCEVTGKKVSQLCRPFMSGNSNVQMGKEDNSYVKKSLRPDNSDTSVASWRERASKSFLSNHNSEDEDSEDEVLKRESTIGIKPSSSVRSTVYDITLKNIISPMSSKDVDIENEEPRIIAPNVDKISPISVVEVRLQSIGECVAILCSVDVLKMRSVFFYEVLNEQEENRIYCTRENNDIWREPLLIPEVSPFEAAAFIEALHEGRLLSKGEWNYCWARLSVSWQVQELVLEYASLIESHFGKLLSYVQRNNWRTNPNILQGARVAVFRKGPTLMPTVVTGIVIEAAPTTGYSKLRVLFDSTEKYVPSYANTSYSNPVTTTSTACNSPIIPLIHPSPSSRPKPMQNAPNSTYMNPINKSMSNINAMSMNPSTATALSAAYGDIGEPFWIQQPQSLVTPPLQYNQNQTHSAPGLSQYNIPVTPRYMSEQEVAKGPTYAMWCDPDEAFITEIKKHITISDKIVFWEMAKAIMELPKLSEHCDSVIRNSKDLAAILKRTEFKFLWSPDAPDLLPKDAASELVSAAYVVNY